MKFAGRRAALAMAGVAAAAGFLGAASTTAIASSVPYTDARAVGSIGLCNAAGQAVTKGSIRDTPFITTAIDSTAAPAPYNVAGETAALFIYQPRQGVQPSDWYGEQIGATSQSSTPQHPTAALTAGDGALSVPLADYPPKWDGLMQLRVYLGAPNEPTYNSTYDATSIKISGDTWQVVDGAAVSCGDGKSVSLEQVYASAYPQLTKAPSSSPGAGGATPKPGSTSGASAQATGAAATDAGAGASAAAAGSAGTGGSASAPGSAGASSPPAVAAGSSSSSGKHGGTSAILWIVVVVGVLGAGAVAVQWRRSKPLPRRAA